MTDKETFHVAQQITSLKDDSVTTRFSGAKAGKTEEEHEFDNWPSVCALSDISNLVSMQETEFFPLTDCSSPTIHKST